MKIDGYTSLYGIVAYPIKHSLSPLMHNISFDYHHINSIYLAFEVKDSLNDFIDSVKTLSIKGFNVSMPYKKEIISYLDEISEEARLTQSVNTVKVEENKLIGYSSDGEGFVLSLYAKDWVVKDQTFVILGAGGASRSIIVSLIKHNAKKIIVYNRSYKKEILDYNGLYHTCIEFRLLDEKEQLKKDLKEAYMLIHTTSVGMNKHECLIDESFLCDGLKVVDIIYKRKMTLLLEMAENKGLDYMNGIDMLIYQGAVSFKIWSGYEMPIERVRKEIELLL